MSDTAILWIVATPIGNLGDLGPRAVEVLSSVAVIAAEDTRHTGRLLARAGIVTPMVAMHEHNEHRRLGDILARLDSGRSVAVVSDAGTPLISDPGFDLVRHAREQGVAIQCVPGPCAAIAALSVAGMPTDRFVFEGFLPHKQAARRRRLAELDNETRTLVLYESSHRILAAARDLAAVLGSTRRVVVARELTKIHEQSVGLEAGELASWLTADANRQRGEFVLVVAGAPPRPDQDTRQDNVIALDALLHELLALTGTRDAVKVAVRLTGQPRNHVYKRAMALKS